jgi:hypothetical protein
MSRRKQEQVEAATQRQRDKYAIEKDVDLAAIEDVGDGQPQDTGPKVSVRQVPLSACKGRCALFRAETTWRYADG